MTIPYGAIYRQKIVPFSVESHNLRVFGHASFKGRTSWVNLLVDN